MAHAEPPAASPRSRFVAGRVRAERECVADLQRARTLYGTGGCFAGTLPAPLASRERQVSRDRSTVLAIQPQTRSRRAGSDPVDGPGQGMVS